MWRYQCRNRATAHPRQILKPPFWKFRFVGYSVFSEKLLKRNFSPFKKRKLDPISSLNIETPASVFEPAGQTLFRKQQSCNSLWLQKASLSFCLSLFLSNTHTETLPHFLLAFLLPAIFYFHPLSLSVSVSVSNPHIFAQLWGFCFSLLLKTTFLYLRGILKLRRECFETFRNISSAFLFCFQVIQTISTKFK